MVPTRGGEGAAKDNGYALDAADLAAAMGEDAAAGLTPVFVNVNVGSTNSCAVDPVIAIGEVCRRWRGAPFGSRDEGGVGGMVGFFVFCWGQGYGNVFTVQLLLVN